MRLSALAAPLEQALQKPEHLKVQVFYTTQEAVSEAARQMALLGVKPPYYESAICLIPAGTVFQILEGQWHPLADLREAGVVPADARLHRYDLSSPMRDELAYVLTPSR